MAIKKTCDAFGVTSLRSASLQEEQERELATEVEEERQVERPAPAKPRTHSIHPDVIQWHHQSAERRHTSDVSGAIQDKRSRTLCSFKL